MRPDLDVYFGQTPDLDNREAKTVGRAQSTSTPQPIGALRPFQLHYKFEHIIGT